MKSPTSDAKRAKDVFWIQSFICGINFSNNILITHNQFHNNLRLCDVLPNFPFTTSETMANYYL